jgi:hypothetical protein
MIFLFVLFFRGDGCGGLTHTKERHFSFFFFFGGVGGVGGLIRAKPGGCTSIL